MTWNILHTETPHFCGGNVKDIIFFWYYPVLTGNNYVTVNVVTLTRYKLKRRKIQRKVEFSSCLLSFFLLDAAGSGQGQEANFCEYRSEATVKFCSPPYVPHVPPISSFLINHNPNYNIQNVCGNISSVRVCLTRHVIGFVINMRCGVCNVWNANLHTCCCRRM